MSALKDPVVAEGLDIERLLEGVEGGLALNGTVGEVHHGVVSDEVSVGGVVERAFPDAPL